MKIETLPEGERVVRMADNVKEIQIPLEDSEETQTGYIYDEVVFDLPEDREDIRTAEDIQADFDAWWEYGSQDPEEAASLEEQVAMLTDVVMSLIG